MLFRSHIEKRIKEAANIGFKKCIIPSANMKTVKNIKNANDIEIYPVSNVQEALEILM